MFCKNCGKEFADNDKFCGECGAKREDDSLQEVSGNDVCVEAEEIQTVSAEQNEVNEPTAGEVHMIENGTARKGRFFGKKTVAVIACAVAVVAAVAVFAGDAVMNFVYRTIMPASSYLKYVQEENMDRLNDGIDELSAIVDGGDLYEDGISADIGVTVGETLKGVLLENVDPQVAPYVSWINEIGVSFNAESDGGNLGGSGKFLINGKDIISADAVLDTKDGYAYITLADFSDKTLKVESGYKMDNEEAAQLRKLIKSIPDEDVINNILNRYTGIITSQMKKVSKSKANISADGVSQKCNLLTITIDGETVYNIVKAVLNEAKDDRVLKDAIRKVVSGYGGNPDEVLKIYDEELAIALENLANEEIPEFDEIPYIDLWVSNSAEIIGAALRLDSFEFRIQTATSGAKSGMVAELNVPDTNLSFSGNYAKKAGKLNGTYKLAFNGMDIVNADVIDVNCNDLDDDDFNGKIVISVADAASGLLSLSGADEGVMNMVRNGRIEIESSLESQLKISAFSNDNLLGAVDFAVKEYDGKGVVIPKNNIEEDGNKWESELKFEKLIRALVDAGAPQELESILALMSM